MTRYFGVIGNRDHIKINKGTPTEEKRPFWEFLDEQPDAWLCSLAYERDDVPTDRQRLWDCGAWSYKDKDTPAFSASKPVTPHTVLARYMQVAQSGDFVVAPDHMLLEHLTPEQLDARREFNRASAVEFLQLAQGTGFIPMGVVHGLTVEERVQHAVFLRDLGYTALAVGGIAARASQKKLAIGWVEAIRAVTPGMWLHVLGLSSPAFMAQWKRLGVDSCDGSSHFKQAFTGGAFFSRDGASLIKHKAARSCRETFQPLEPITAPECSCTACVRLRHDGIDTRTYGSNENNMGRAAHNLNMLMRAQKAAMQEVTC